MSDYGVVIPPDKGDANYGAPHTAEAYRRGHGPTLTFGWQCLTAGCGAEADGFEVAVLAEAAARRHSRTPQEGPQQPAGAPNGAGVADGTSPGAEEALRARLAEVFYTWANFLEGDDAPAPFEDASEGTRDLWLQEVDARLLPLVLAYGAEQRREGAERALREAAAAITDGRGVGWESDLYQSAANEWLTVRADAICEARA